MYYYTPPTLKFSKTRSKIYRCDSDGTAMVAIDIIDISISWYLNEQTFNCPDIKMNRYINVEIFKYLNI